MTRTGRRSLIPALVGAAVLTSCGTEPDQPVNLPDLSELEAPSPQDET